MTVYPTTRMMMRSEINVVEFKSTTLPKSKPDILIFQVPLNKEWYGYDDNYKLCLSLHMYFVFHSMNHMYCISSNKQWNSQIDTVVVWHCDTETIRIVPSFPNKEVISSPHHWIFALLAQFQVTSFFNFDYYLHLYYILISIVPTTFIFPAPVRQKVPLFLLLLFCLYFR